MTLKLQQQLSPRLQGLLEDLRDHSKRSQFIIATLLILFSLSFLTNLNEKSPGGNLARADVRMINLALNDKYYPPSLHTSQANNGKPEYIISKSYLAKDQEELNYIRRLQILSLEGIDVPILGIKISAANAGLVAALFGLALYSWLIFSIEKEQTALAHILFPLFAKHQKNTALRLWDTGGDPINNVIEFYQHEICRVREAVSSSFLFIYADTRPAMYERFASYMVVLPALMLCLHVGLDYYWDVEKRFPEGGKNNTYVGELSNSAIQLCNYLDEITNSTATNNYKNNNKSLFATHPCPLLVKNAKSQDFENHSLAREVAQTSQAISILSNHRDYIIYMRFTGAIVALIVLVLALISYSKIRKSSKILSLSFYDANKVMYDFIESKLDVPNLKFDHQEGNAIGNRP